MSDIEYPKFDDLGKGVVPFDDYFDAHVGIIREAQTILAKPLANDPQLNDIQAREAESYLATMLSVEAWAASYLDAAEHLALGKLPGKSVSWTDLDRKKALAANVSRQKRFLAVVSGIIKSIDKRISYTQSRLRFLERNSG